MHATGRYPDWWQGKRFDKPTIAWAAGVTGESTRDNPQRVLLGRPGCHGTGAIPKDALVEVTSARGAPGLIDTIQVRHVGGGISRIALKSYEKGREKWQGETLDWVWFDEEPPLPIYTEGLTRTNVGQGPVWMTFTPLLGMSQTVGRFILEKSPARHVTIMTIDDAEHYTPAQRAAIAATYPAHEREARLKGTPALGSGRIFPVAQESIAVDALPIAPHWAQIGGIDFGWDHPTAAVKLAWDRDADVVYVTAGYRVREATPLIHAGALKPWGANLPWAWPHDGLQHDKTSGEQLAEAYRKHGLKLLPDRSAFQDGTSGVEAGLLIMLERMQTGRLKVFAHLADWFEEFRLYHRDDGKVVKLRDDLMSATRYALMCLRFARPVGRDSFDRRIEYPQLGIV
jgi:phage terminase large subunit-like protein